MVRQTVFQPTKEFLPDPILRPRFGFLQNHTIGAQRQFPAMIIIKILRTTPVLPSKEYRQRQLITNRRKSQQAGYRRSAEEGATIILPLPKASQYRTSLLCHVHFETFSSENDSFGFGSTFFLQQYETGKEKSNHMPTLKESGFFVLLLTAEKAQRTSVSSGRKNRK